MREDAQNLTKALKGDNKTQGNWGEMILQRVLESSGLTEGEEFETQHSTTTDEGARIQPDVIVKLPDGKHVVIDSKVSLVAYEQYVNSESDEERNKLVVLHINSLKAHIKGLSEKDYFKGKGINSPDFILLFVPIESSFSLAIRHDEQLYAFALERNVVIVSPTTLLATLRTIHHMWSQERQTRNAQLIAEEAGKLLGAFALFGKEVEDLEKHLLKSSDTFQEMKKRMSEGRGNLVSRIEKLQKLGVKSTRTLPDILRTDDDPDNDNDNGNLE